MVLISVSLMITDMELLFMHLFGYFYASLGIPCLERDVYSHLKCQGLCFALGLPSGSDSLDFALGPESLVFSYV